MFTGGSQFALVGVLAAGGGAVAAILTATLLGSRNGLYALHIAPLVNVTGWRRLAAAQLTIDESTAMALAHEQADEGEESGAASRLAFWSTGLSIFVLWNIGTLLGAVGASMLSDPALLGLDAAIPAGFLALLWPRLRGREAWAVATAGAVLALVLIPLAPAGVPVLASALIAVAAGFAGDRRKAAP